MQLWAAVGLLLAILLQISVLFHQSHASTTQQSVNRCVSTTDLDQQLPDPNKRLKWAIIALTLPGSKDIHVRNKAIADKIRPFAKKHQIEMVFFSELNFPNATVTQFQQTFNGLAKVITINTAHNGFIGKKRYGYKYMCKFFAIDLYEHLKSHRYDYYLRIDSDCYMEQLNYDIFQYVIDKKIEYGYALRKLEAHGPTKLTLPVWTQKYVQRCSIKPSALTDKPLSTCFNFYNNFHIGKVSFFLRPDVQHYLLAVNESGHILSDRWGDSVIQAYAVRLFMDPTRIKPIPQFSYVHGSHANVLVSTFDNGVHSNVPQKLPLWQTNTLL